MSENGKAKIEQAVTVDLPSLIGNVTSFLAELERSAPRDPMEDWRQVADDLVRTRETVLAAVQLNDTKVLEQARGHLGELQGLVLQCWHKAFPG